MQNQPEKKSGSFKKFLRDKGYYIVLALCVVAVGVSGYLFVRTAADQSSNVLGSEPSLSVPLTPSGTESKQPSKPSTATQPSSAETAEEPAEDAAGAVDEEPLATGSDLTEPAEAVVTIRPLEGDTIAVYSMDALAYNETTQDWRTHNGIDIAATAGQEVLSAQDGTVSAVYEDDAFGKTVVVSHAGGYTTHYANLSPETAVTAGQTVNAGDVLGTVGDTATVELAQEGHLHFAVSHNSEPVDPEQFLLS